MLAEFKDPQRAADEMKRIVHQRGAEDNLTAVVIQVGRARQSPLMSIEGASLYAQGKPADAQAAAGRGASGGRSGRIQVDFGNKQQATGAVSREQSPALGDQTSRRQAADPHPAVGSPASRILLWGLVAAVLVGVAFYAGLRASDFFASPSAGGSSDADPLAAGRGAFDRGDYQSALTPLASCCDTSRQTSARGTGWDARSLSRASTRSPRRISTR